MQLETWLVYVLAVIGLSLSPGPNGLLALTHGALYGHRMTLYTIVGGCVGFVLVIALSLFGIGALLKASLFWLSVLKWVGGAYLVWLGIQIWRSPPLGVPAPDAVVVAKPGSWLFRQGLLSAISNPKVILFFVAFLPQFIDPSRSLLLQFAVLAGTFAVIEFSTELLVASLASRISIWLARVGRRFNHCCGAAFIAIGVALPLRG
ncbi:MAG: LysE family transporter [Halopseudomonas sp.]|uniref:LysE family translocator n=1 Tax=Halopseudomonas sp. TaxID=2901191 RepID=UPI003002DC07